MIKPPELGFPEPTTIYTNFSHNTEWYTLEDLHAVVREERLRNAAIATRWGETHADGMTVNARNAASKIARGILGTQQLITEFATKDDDVDPF